jgi:hypothetical protein
MRSNSALMTEVMLTDLAEKANIKMRNIGRTGLQAGELKEAFNLYVLASLSIDSEGNVTTRNVGVTFDLLEA